MACRPGNEWRSPELAENPPSTNDEVSDGDIPTPTRVAVDSPPFTRQSALLKVGAAEDAWNWRDPDRVALVTPRIWCGGTGASSWLGANGSASFWRQVGLRIDYWLVKDLGLHRRPD